MALWFAAAMVAYSSVDIDASSDFGSLTAEEEKISEAFHPGLVGLQVSQHALGADAIALLTESLPGVRLHVLSSALTYVHETLVWSEKDQVSRRLKYTITVDFQKGKRASKNRGKTGRTFSSVVLQLLNDSGAVVTRRRASLPKQAKLSRLQQTIQLFAEEVLSILEPEIFAHQQSDVIVPTQHSSEFSKALESDTVDSKHHNAWTLWAGLRAPWTGRRNRLDSQPPAGNLDIAEEFVGAGVEFAVSNARWWFGWSGEYATGNLDSQRLEGALGARYVLTQGVVRPFLSLGIDFLSLRNNERTPEEIPRFMQLRSAGELGVLLHTQDNRWAFRFGIEYIPWGLHREAVSSGGQPTMTGYGGNFWAHYRFRNGWYASLDAGVKDIRILYVGLGRRRADNEEFVFSVAESVFEYKITPSVGFYF